MKKSLFVLGGLCICAGGFLAWFVPHALWSTPTTDKEIQITIENGWGAERVAEELARQGSDISPFGYKFYALLDPTAAKPRPGPYSVWAQGENYRHLARTFAIGPARNEISIKVIEGMDTTDISEMLTHSVSPDVAYDYGQLVGGPGQPFDQSLRADYAFLSGLPKSASLEGYLFPDTYRVWKDQLPQSLVRKQLETFGTKTFELADEARKQGKAFHEVIILASILEKEVASPEDRKIVAGIFLNRLRDGMPLQSDATVNYVTRASRARPTLKDLEADSPYNTYRNKGLPPGPISNPSLAAIDAALHPQASDYKYFLTDDQGKIYFAKTFEEHKLNRKRAYGE